MRTTVALALALAVLMAGCGSRCAEVRSARATLATRPTAATPGPDVRVIVPLARANALIAELLARTPLAVALDLPELGPIALAVPGGLTATARTVELRPGPAGRVRVAIELAIADAAAPPLTLALVAEVEPTWVRAGAEVAVEIGVGPANLVTIAPSLGPDATAALGAAVERWLPPAVRRRVPRLVVDAAAAKLATYLTGAAYDVLRATLLVRLGAVTRVRLRLPEVPIADVAIRSVDAPTAALVVELHTGLPIRRGLWPLVTIADDVQVTIAAGTVAELANWAIDAGHAPRWYDRSLTPDPDGAFRPRFDYVADARDHPWKVHVLQERGGCSYFRVGVRVALALDGEELRATALDRQLERAIASPVLEVAAWAKYVVVGSIDQTRRRAAQLTLTLADQPLTTRVVSVALVDDELRVGAAFALGPAPVAPAAATPPPVADDDPPVADDDPPRCYPYLPTPAGACPTTCATRADCAGSRGPADFAEHGWPLDCINARCVPLAPEHVHP